jgi:phosphoserine aminotransferase
MSQHVYNFNPGPAALPRPVLERAQHELVDFQGLGMSIMEMSHRSMAYDQVHNQAIADLRALLCCSDEHAMLFMGGGALTQFALVAMNLLHEGSFAQYLVTGNWSETALHEAGKLGDARELWSSAASGFTRVPNAGEFEVDAKAAYLHYTSNNTIVGTQYPDIPYAGSVPLVCDMSSDILSRPVDVSRFGLVYAGAQKNMGPAGVTVVIIHRELLDHCRSDLPASLSYSQVVAKNSLLNTPPTFAIYMVGLVAQHLLALGGLPAIAARNAEKAQLVYRVIDVSGGFYRGCARPESRSHMNITFHLPSEELETRFAEESARVGLVGLKGHRSVGGLRASLYNAVSLGAVQTLVEFMQDFQQHWG